MTQLPLTFPELVEVMHACGPIHPEECTPARLRAIMVKQLTLTDPRLASRVQQFDADQMEALSTYIMTGLSLVAVPAA
jgi:hypothetical protein